MKHFFAGLCLQLLATIGAGVCAFALAAIAFGVNLPPAPILMHCALMLSASIPAYWFGLVWERRRWL